MENNDKKKATKIIRNVYLYLVSMIGLITLIFGTVGIINNVLTNYVFQVNDYVYTDPYMAGKGGICAQQYVDSKDVTGKTMITPTKEEIDTCKAELEKQNEQNRKNNIGREFASSIANILVGLPIWLYHWSVVQRESRKHEDELA